MHNIRPAGQMWPADAFNLARQALKFVFLAYFLDNYTLRVGKNISFWPLSTAKIFFGPPGDLSCAPLL